jgi:uncharacterized protein YbjT (DUF2867 family)
MILLTGVTGLIGQATAEYLLNRGVAFRGLARDSAKAADLSERGMAIIQGDMLEAADMARAVRGVTSALLLTPNGQRQMEMERTFARAAAAAGVSHLVKISTIRATADARASFPITHFRSEEFIKSLGMRWTMLRPNFFMQNLLAYAPAIAKSGTFKMPVGRIRIGMIDARDVAEIAARRLLDNSPQSTSHDLSGPELLDFFTVAARMSVVLGRAINYVEQSPADFRAFMEKIIPDPWQVNAMCELFADIASKALGPPTDDAERLLGRKPRSIESFLADYAERFTG